MDRTIDIIAELSPACWTFSLQSPHVYSTILLSRRRRLTSLRLRLVSRRRNTAACVGLVFFRGLGGRLACWMSRTKRCTAACRLRSCERYWRASMVSIPPELKRLPASLASLSFTFGSKLGDLLTSKRSWTAVATLLTFWPPGPGARTKASSISSSLSWIVGEMRIMLQV